MEHLLQENIIERRQIVQPMKATYDDLITTHTPHYVNSFINGTIEEKEMKKTGFQWSKGLVNRCQTEVGNAIKCNWILTCTKRSHGRAIIKQHGKNEAQSNENSISNFVTVPNLKFVFN